MLNDTADILRLHPIRKTKEQKKAFRDDVIGYVKELGYQAYVEEGQLGAQNLVIGDPDSARYLLTAHYDTPGTIGIPNKLAPCNVFHTGLVFGRNVLFGMLFGFGVGFLFGEGYRFAGIVFTCLFVLIMLALRFQLLPANKSNVNDNSSGVITLLEIARTLPQAHRGKVCFVLFDLEEWGLVGSSSYRRAHKQATEQQVVLNLDCVGDGDHIIFFPTKKAKQDQVLMNRVHRLGGWFGKKNILLHQKGFSMFPSDQRNFPLGFGIAAFQKSGKIGYFCDKIHTSKDTVLDPTNVNLLRAALTTLICEESGKDQKYGS